MKLVFVTDFSTPSIVTKRDKSPVSEASRSKMIKIKGGQNVGARV